MTYPPSIQKLIELFSRFPTIGPRTAARFVFYLMRLDKEKIEDFLSSVTNLKKTIKTCSFCFNFFESSQDSSTAGVCPICNNPGRDKTLLCIIEKETDLLSIEKTKKYKGIYFILGGTISALKKSKNKELRIKELLDRIKEPENFGISGCEFKEIIIAINPTTEGEATALYLESLLGALNKKTRLAEDGKSRRVTRLGRGLPVGAELEYADKETLSSALESRR
ncbi:MAG: recombination mediator RecR [Candidatus Nealsonbacteria bacterium]|nr:recombination mediator RecR [Candidatus Nealsonbacteria bacterium]